MNRILAIIVLTLCMQNVQCQTEVDKEMQRLMEVVTSLRVSDKARQKVAWEKASETLSGDKAWTIMDEIVPDMQNECRLTDHTISWFSLNRILSQHVGYDDIKSRGDFLNGEDVNFNYSLIERSVKPKKTVNYDLKSREGKQIFVIIPFDPTIAKLEVSIYRTGKILGKGKKGNDGNIYLVIPESQKIMKEDVLTLRVKNASAKGSAFVIINHCCPLKIAKRSLK